MVSLAALKYGDVLLEHGGPIERIETGALWVFDEQHRLANAYLRDELAAGRRELSVFGTADGTGVADSPAGAAHRAISEALQRWAYLAVRDGRSAAAFGFREDPSPNGMAAFPGLFRRHAQALARADAMECHALVSWWDGRLPAERLGTRFPGVEAVRIHHDAGPGEVVILFRRTRAGYAYGHGSGPDLPRAIGKAVVAMARSEQALATFRALGSLGTPAGFFERRALFFAGEEGAEQFGRRLLSRPEKPALPFRPLFDGEIPGPWSRWATVWRCCARLPTDDYLDPDVNFFYW